MSPKTTPTPYPGQHDRRKVRRARAKTDPDRPTCRRPGCA